LNIIFSHGTQVNTVEVSPQEAELLAKGAQLDWSSPVLELRWNGKGAFIRTTLLRHTAQEQSPRGTMAPQAGRHQPQLYGRPAMFGCDLSHKKNLYVLASSFLAEHAELVEPDDAPLEFDGFCSMSECYILAYGILPPGKYTALRAALHPPNKPQLVARKRATNCHLFGGAPKRASLFSFWPNRLWIDNGGIWEVQRPG
jgi:hypothetical protein